MPHRHVAGVKDNGPRLWVLPLCGLGRSLDTGGRCGASSDHKPPRCGAMEKPCTPITHRYPSSPRPGMEGHAYAPFLLLIDQIIEGLTALPDATRRDAVPIIVHARHQRERLAAELAAEEAQQAALAEQWEAEEANRDMLMPTTSHGDFVWYGPPPIIVS